MADPEDPRTRTEAQIQRCYSTWGTSYYADFLGPGAPYPPVHIDLLRRLVLESGARTVLDAGCGPASFLRHLMADGLDLHGFDLTAEMVAEAKRIFAEHGQDAARVWQGSVLDRGTFRSARAEAPAAFDAAVCVGVMPHIAATDERTLFDNLHAAVRPGGLAIVEARNQLFSLFTLNRPSYEFIRDELVRADELLDRAGESRAPIATALEDMKQQFRMDLPPVRRGKADEPGYDEVLSRTHNPFVVKDAFAAAGFRDVRVLFYHFHALPPMFAGSAGDTFLRESVAMEQPEDWRGYFMASAFLVCGTRA